MNEALRRALVVRAVGGDPHRELDLGETAVERLAGELDGPDRRERLLLALASLRGESERHPAVVETIAALAADPELAWRCYAAALLADALSPDGTER